MTFPLAPMSKSIRALTLIVLTFPALLAAAGLLSPVPGLLLVVAALLAVIYLAIWLLLRPSDFEARETGLTLRFPWRTTEVSRARLRSARLVAASELRNELGFVVRVGAGGLWGGFGWLWSRGRGWVEIYVSRLDGFVWLERRDGMPLLLTPADSERFIAALQLPTADRLGLPTADRQALRAADR